MGQIRLGVIHESPKVTESSRQLLMCIKDRNYSALYLRISKLSVWITDHLDIRYSGHDMQLDGGIIRSLGFITTTEQLVKRIDVLQELENQGVVLINSPKGILDSRDKYQSLIKLKRRGLPVPETAVVETPMEAMMLTREWGNVVIKPVMGSLGLGIVRVGDPDIAFRVSKSILSINQPVYIQKYVEKPGRDIRIIVVGDKVLGGVYRINQTSWKTNVAQGSTVQTVKITSELEELSLSAVETLGLDYAGLDIVESSEGYKILEVNASPLWEGFTRGTGILPAGYIVDHLIKKIRR
ncbi:alpha-galactosidase [Sulfolobales archaeon HS-7]|nr:alpha-galactosidase [Sulfolobales archaeon HS-7]